MSADSKKEELKNAKEVHNRVTNLIETEGAKQAAKQIAIEKIKARQKGLKRLYILGGIGGGVIGIGLGLVLGGR